jgi:preprotein translocase subunit SecG
LNIEKLFFIVQIDCTGRVFLCRANQKQDIMEPNNDYFDHRPYYRSSINPLAKLTLFVTAIFFILLLLGWLLPDDTPEPPHYQWKPPPKIEYNHVRSPAPVQYRPSQVTTGCDEYPEYYNSAAGHWDEFLEDLDAYGLDPWDPEAQELWDNNYGY